MSDLISREQFREQMYHRCFEVNNDENMQRWDGGNWLRWKLFEEELDKAPSAEPKKGEWIDFSMSIKGVPTEACGECGEWSLGMGKNYCPNCGADMRGE